MTPQLIRLNNPCKRNSPSSAEQYPKYKAYPAELVARVSPDGNKIKKSQNNRKYRCVIEQQKSVLILNSLESIQENKQYYKQSITPLTRSCDQGGIRRVKIHLKYLETILTAVCKAPHNQQSQHTHMYNKNASIHCCALSDPHNGHQTKGSENQNSEAADIYNTILIKGEKRERVR
jgi:hypothetical protein